MIINEKDWEIIKVNAEITEVTEVETLDNVV